ncbi:hypothetical protein FA15DRAFT_672050, partial [Coprinopsis marcescibilis]
CERPFVDGDDLTPVLVDAVIKLLSIASYNHFCSNHSRNCLGARRSARAASSTTRLPPIVYCGHPNHVVVIKRPPLIFCSGRSVIKIFNECKVLFFDSFLPTSRVSTFCSWIRVKYRKLYNAAWWPLHSVLPLLSYMLKAPLPPRSSITSTGSATFLRPSEGLSESWDSWP